MASGDSFCFGNSQSSYITRIVDYNNILTDRESIRLKNQEEARLEDLLFTFAGFFLPILFFFLELKLLTSRTITIINKMMIIIKFFVSILFHQESLKVVDDCVFIEFNLFTSLY